MQYILSNCLILAFIVPIVNMQYIQSGNRFYHNPYKSGNRFTPLSFRPTFRDKYGDSEDFDSYRSHFNDDKNDEYPVNVGKIYHIKPIKPLNTISSFETPKVIEKYPKLPKPHLFVEDYSEDEYQEPNEPEKQLGYVVLSGSDDKDDEEEDSKHKKGGAKHIAAVEKHSDSGHKGVEFSKVGGALDSHLEARKEGEKKKFKKGAEYSHDRGHGFIKSWSWDRKHVKADAEGELDKKLKEVSAGHKKGFVAVKGKANEEHLNKGLTALKGGVVYVEDNEESSEKSPTTGNIY